MDIYFIRHADAIPQGENGIETDEQRPLSDEGIQQANSLAHAFKKRGITFDLIATSPLVRAQQTTAALRTILEIEESHVVTSDELAPGGRPRKLSRYVNGQLGNSIALVGHQPDLSMYAAWLLGEKEVQIHFAKAGAAYI
ncbi:MAG: phosphohistidine phosphatase SixA, partial [Planctomycetes bacterium]|nr:phosphohistidine phosphatase SixA [Planctomycetota bacterium]